MTARLTTILCVVTAALAQTGQAPEFDVASIRPSVAAHIGGEGSGAENLSVSPTTITMRNASLSYCIQWAYGVRFYQVSGPDWTRRLRYDVVAKTATPSASEQQLRAMMQRLLADRFQLRLHRDLKSIPVYELTAASGGRKLTRSANDENSGVRVINGSFVFQHVTMSDFAERLSDLSAFDRPVLDKTGLEGSFDITLPSAAAAMRENPDSIFSAVESIGLRLAPRKRPVEMLVIDRAMQPSPN